MGRPDKENDNGIIIWITSNEGFVKRIFQRAAQVKSENVRFIPHIPYKAKDRKTAIEKILKEQKNSRDPDLKYSLWPGKDDLAILLKYKENHGTRGNPYTEIAIEEFDKDDKLPPIQTIALKRYNDNAVVNKTRERFLKTQSNPEATAEDEETVEDEEKRKDIDP